MPHELSTALNFAKVASPANDIVEEKCAGMTILKLAGVKPRRRVLYLNCYGMAVAWRLWRDGQYPGQQLWGCLELVRLGYEVAMPEEPRQDSLFFHPRRQDFNHMWFARDWLGRDGIVYSAYTVLFWLPLLASLGLLRCPIVTLLYARGENLHLTRGYRGLLALTPAAKRRATSLAPHAKVAHISWSVDLSFYPILSYNPNWFLSCGKTRRDFTTLRGAAGLEGLPIRVISAETTQEDDWPTNVTIFSDKPANDWKTVSYDELLYKHYEGCTAALIILQDDPSERYGAGLTQLLEAMVMARPVIVTRTGALAGEIDVEKEGCGLHVPPNDGPALARAMRAIAENPIQARAMGMAGRRLCETRYSSEHFGEALHEFFERL